LKKESVEKLAAICKGPEYPKLLKQFIVQGLIKIEESVVEIQCRPEDKSIVAKIVRLSTTLLVPISHLSLIYFQILDIHS
jgi:vacuolar-type H+-ATPase subunit E/Vma4